MSVEKPCPSKSILVGFVSGDLPEPDAKTLESHLSKCDSCGDTVRAMHANDTMKDLGSLETRRAIDGCRPVMPATFTWSILMAVD